MAKADRSADDDPLRVEGGREDGDGYGDRLDRLSHEPIGFGAPARDAATRVAASFGAGLPSARILVGHVRTARAASEAPPT